MMRKKTKYKLVKKAMIERLSPFCFLGRFVYTAFHMTDNQSQKDIYKKGKAPQSASGRLPYATLKNPTIEAILGNHFRFANKAQALDRLSNIRTSFQTLKSPPESTPTPEELTLWIRGYGMTSEARIAGYLGNFAKLRVAQAALNKWTITATLLNLDKKHHPERRQIPQKFPNWGQPILRDIKKNRLHKNVESAQQELARLHEAFPEVTIPLTNKLYIMIYRKPAPGESPVEKWVLEITAQPEGFVITAKLNTHKPPAQKTENPVEAPQPQGKFTSQVLLAQSKRKPRIKPKKPH